MMPVGKGNALDSRDVVFFGPINSTRLIYLNLVAFSYNKHQLTQTEFRYFHQTIIELSFQGSVELEHNGFLPDKLPNHKGMPTYSICAKT